MVEALYSLSKTSLPKELQHLIPKSKMVFQYDLIVTLIIIISMVKDIHLLQSLFMPLNVFWRLFRCLNHMPFDLPFAVLSNIVDLFVKFKDLLFLIFIQVRSEESNSILSR